MLTLVLAESAIELVPNEIMGHASVRASARRKNKKPQWIILDQTHHHAAMLKMKGQGIGRGRPDIVHSCLLLALGSPLNIEGQLACYVHTRDDHVITIHAHTRLPRNYERFVSLLEQLYEESQVPVEGSALMTIKQLSLQTLLSELKPDQVTALTTQGRRETLPVVVRELAASKRPVILVGGFPEGHFSQTTLESATGKYCIDSRRLDAASVVARAIYDYETAIGLPRFAV